MGTLTYLVRDWRQLCHVHAKHLFENSCTDLVMNCWNRIWLRNQYLDTGWCLPFEPKTVPNVLEGEEKLCKKVHLLLRKQTPQIHVMYHLH